MDFGLSASTSAAISAFATGLLTLRDENWSDERSVQICKCARQGLVLLSDSVVCQLVNAIPVVIRQVSVSPQTMRFEVFLLDFAFAQRSEFVYTGTNENDGDAGIAFQ